jgi:glycosyltransferase involved in cell wall biosynthesis
MRSPIPKTCTECGGELAPKQPKLCSDVCSVSFRVTLGPPPESVRSSLSANEGGSGEKMDAQFSLAVCFPVWNRADLFLASYNSLLRQLESLEASIWVFDNGSDAPTRSVLSSLNSPSHRVFKVSLPGNFGIPFVANVFISMLQNCDFVGFRAPSHILFADADIYFKMPLLGLINILENDNDAGIISGHDSVEHECVRVYSVGGLTVKEKAIERGACLVLRRELFADCAPFCHNVPDTLDWQLMLRHPRSMAARRLKVLAVDAVVHLGLYDSTWHPVGVPADQKEVDEINHFLQMEGLFSPDRRQRMSKYCHQFNLVVDERYSKEAARLSLSGRLKKVAAGIFLVQD